MSYTITFKIANASMLSYNTIVLNGNAIYPSNGQTGAVEADSILKITSKYGSIFLNGANAGKEYSLNVSSDVEVELKTDYNVYIITDETSEGGTNASGGGHKTLIDGAACEITGGRTMVNGTVYDIIEGKVLVDGTVCDIPMGGSVTVAITKSQNIYGERGKQYIEIGGVQYNDLVTLTVDSSESMFLQTYSMVSLYNDSTYVSVNGIKVAEGSVDGVGTSDKAASYTLELRGLKTVTIEMIAVNSYAGAILVTTT